MLPVPLVDPVVEVRVLLPEEEVEDEVKVEVEVKEVEEEVEGEVEFMRLEK